MLGRSGIGPALLWQIEKKNKIAGQVLEDLKQLDDKIENPKKYEQMNKEKYMTFKHERLSVLTTQPETQRTFT